MWRLAISQMPSCVMEEQDVELLMAEYSNTPASQFKQALLECMDEVLSKKLLTFDEVGIVLEDFLSGYHISREDEEEISV